MEYDVGTSGDNEISSGDVIDYGTNATLTCNDGFFLLGEVTRLCEGNDSTGVWSGSATMCSGVYH